MMGGHRYFRGVSRLRFRFLLLFLLLGVISLASLTSCSSENGRTELEQTNTESEAGEYRDVDPGVTSEQSVDQLHEGAGRILKVMQNGVYLEIQHGEIVGYMGAMTMLFQVADTSLVRGIVVGDSIHFHVDRGGTIMRVTRVSTEKDL